MSRRHNHRFTTNTNEETGVIMDTSIGSDGERSDNDYDHEDVTPSTTPVFESSGTAKLQKRSSNDFVLKLKFSIENILKPDFGSKTSNGIRGSANSDTSDSPPMFAATPSPLASPRGGNASGRNSISENLLSPISVTSGGENQKSNTTQGGSPASLWPAWVYCTRYSDRPSSGPRCRRVKRTKAKQEEKRPRTAFTVEQLARLKSEFQANRYLTEKRRQDLAQELGLNESQIKIWFQNKRAKIKKQTGSRNMLALHLMAQGLYNHATIPVVGGEGLLDDDDDMDQDDSIDQLDMTTTPDLVAK